jgi:hypothetical protein
MAYSTLVTQVSGERASVSWANQVKSNQEDHESRITILENPIVKNLTNSDSPYTISDSDTFNLYICDTTSGPITINFPTLADNYNKKFQIILTKQDSTHGVILTPEGSDNFTVDQLSTLKLAKTGDRCTIYGNEVSDQWEILEEKISSQLRLNTYAGYGSTDTMIVQFTNVNDDYGNCFSHNHGSYGTSGLEVTINKSGKYSVEFYKSGSSFDSHAGLSLNSTELTTAITAITTNDRLGLSMGGSASLTTSVSIISMFEKDDIIRPHSNGDASSTANRCIFRITYLGN